MCWGEERREERCWADSWGRVKSSIYPPNMGSDSASFPHASPPTGLRPELQVPSPAVRGMFILHGPSSPWSLF